MVTLKPNIGYYDARYVDIAGDTMTGAINLVDTDAQGQALITPINSATTTINAVVRESRRNWFLI